MIGPVCGLQGVPGAEVLAFAAIAAESGHPVLVTGETGSGKTHLARLIHQSGTRTRQPFVRVNCAAIPDSLFEREMFGHVRGAFTDARDGGAGFLEAANGGTLFLDEVSELPLQTQPKLLAVLEDGCFRKLGSPREIHVDVQVIAATNRDLGEMVRLKQFREDLFYRLSVLRCAVPPLRKRTGEIPGLVDALLGRIARGGREPARITGEALNVIVGYPWPGNIRELENALRTASAFSRGEPIRPVHLPPEVRGIAPPATGEGERARRNAESKRYAAPLDPEHEALVIRAALEAAGGNKTRAARSLGMSRSTLWAKLQRFRELTTLRPPPPGGDPAHVTLRAEQVS